MLNRDLTAKQFQTSLARWGFEMVDNDSRNGFRTTKLGTKSCVYCVSRRTLRDRRQTLKTLIEDRDRVENTSPLTEAELQAMERMNKFLRGKFTW